MRDQSPWYEENLPAACHFTEDWEFEACTPKLRGLESGSKLTIQHQTQEGRREESMGVLAAHCPNFHADTFLCKLLDRTILHPRTTQQINFAPVSQLAIALYRASQVVIEEMIT
jgi:hypothetical protein